MQALAEKEKQLNLDLLSAAEAGNSENCRKCLQEGAFVHTTEGWLKSSPLILACMNGHKDTAIMLIDQYGAGMTEHLFTSKHSYIISLSIFTSIFILIVVSI